MSPRKKIRAFREHRLTGVFAAAQRKKANDAGVEMDLAANESIGPERVDQEAVAEQ